MMDSKRIIVGITGASGMIYAKRLLELLGKAGVHVDLVVSEASKPILISELGDGKKKSSGDISSFAKYLPGVKYELHDASNLAAPISSGSVKTDGMVIVPCSMNTLGKIAWGVADNLVCRTAGVMLKERRKLILVPRETPLSAIHLECMLRLSHAGAVILPPCPSFYKNPETIQDLVDSIVGRILDQLDIPHDLDIRWG